MELKCPECGSIVYSRRAKLCGVCSKPLPEEFHFHGEQARKVEQDLNKSKAILKYWQQMPDALSGGVNSRNAGGMPMPPYLSTATERDDRIDWPTP